MFTHINTIIIIVKRNSRFISINKKTHPGVGSKPERVTICCPVIILRFLLITNEKGGAKCGY